MVRTITVGFVFVCDERHRREWSRVEGEKDRWIEEVKVPCLST
jgi:hypothetical protein